MSLHDNMRIPSINYMTWSEISLSHWELSGIYVEGLSLIQLWEISVLSGMNMCCCSFFFPLSPSFSPQPWCVDFLSRMLCCSLGWACDSEVVTSSSSFEASLTCFMFIKLIVYYLPYYSISRFSPFAMFYFYIFWCSSSLWCYNSVCYVFLVFSICYVPLFCWLIKFFCVYLSSCCTSFLQ